MKIINVEELVGITRKNIRFYEAQGLLAPDRAENGDREYSIEDVSRLKQIKLYSQLAVPIEEIRKMLDQEITPEACLEKQIDRLDAEEKRITSTRQMLNHILTNHVVMTEAQVEEYLEQMDKLEQEGTVFMDVKRKDIHRKKMHGAVMGAAFILAAIVITMGVLIWAVIDSGEGAIYAILLAGIPSVLVCIGIIVCLKMRMKEIEGGEEDEASKY